MMIHFIFFFLRAQSLWLINRKRIKQQKITKKNPEMTKKPLEKNKTCDSIGVRLKRPGEIRIR